MGTTMNMSNYEIEQDAMEVEYGAEIMCAGWNPAVDLICEQLLQVPTEEQMSMAAELASQSTLEDVSTAVSDIFLRKMYSYNH